MINFKIAGTGVCIPDKVVTNEDYAAFLDTSDEWITTRTGIKERRIAVDMTTYDMAVKAAGQAMENAGVNPLSIDMVILATATSEYSFPSVACIVQNELGLQNAFCLDISAACTGFVYALDIAAQYFLAGRVKNVLVIASEKLSSVVDYQDRSTCVLHGDAAGAAVLSEDKEGGLVVSQLRADGTGVDKLIYKNVRTKSPWSEEIPDKYCAGEACKLLMNGSEVYKFAVKAFCDTCAAVMEMAGVTAEDIAYVLPHQANIRIINSAISKLKIDESKFHINIEKYGNTSSATIPLLLHELMELGKLKKGDLILLSAFGAGLTSGAMILKI